MPPESPEPLQSGANSETYPATRIEHHRPYASILVVEAGNVFHSLTLRGQVHRDSQIAVYAGDTDIILSPEQARQLAGMLEAAVKEVTNG